MMAAGRVSAWLLSFGPDFAMAYNNLGNLLVSQGKTAAAVENYQKALTYEPNNVQYLIHFIHQAQHLCLWRNLEDLSRQLIAAVEYETPTPSSDEVAPFSFLALPIPTTPAQQLRCGQRKSATLAMQPMALPPRRADKKEDHAWLCLFRFPTARCRLSRRGLV